MIVEKITADGTVNDKTPRMLKASFWPNLHGILPPNDRLMLVRDATGRLLGYRIGPLTGEFKRLYVRPEASGNGLGLHCVARYPEWSYPIEAHPFFVYMQWDVK